MSAYHEVIKSFQRLLLHPGIYGTGLFAAENVDIDRLLIEYTGNRVRGEGIAKMHCALDHIDEEPDVFANI